MSVIDSSKITFLIQGPITEHINQTILDIKHYFSNSLVLISTTDVVGKNSFDIDEYITCPDPGSFVSHNGPGAKMNNINRQIVTTLSGLKKVKTEYCFKLRSDFLINGNDFLSYMDRYKKFETSFRVFKDRIIACNYFSRNPNSVMNFPYHPSDLCFFGLTEDLKKLYDIPLMPDSEIEWDLADRNYNRYFPEQYLFINCLRKDGRVINCDWRKDSNKENIEETEKYFASNFIFLDFKLFNIAPTKKTTFSTSKRPDTFRNCYTHIEWMGLYKKHIDPDLKIPAFDEERKFVDGKYKFFKVVKTIVNFFSIFVVKKSWRKSFRRNVIDLYREIL